MPIDATRETQMKIRNPDLSLAFPVLISSNQRCARATASAIRQVPGLGPW
jgi:hypothetical protein